MTNYSQPPNEYLSHSRTSLMYQRNMMNMNDMTTMPFNFTVSQPTTKIQPTAQSNLSISQVLQMSGCRFFHYTPDDGNFYHITCQIILRGSVFSDDYDYDHGFFYQRSNDSATNYHVKCKLFSHPLIVNILN